MVRTKMLSGPSPVGGSQGGTEGKLVMGLDEFELQAAHYNIACAYARLGSISEVRTGKGGTAVLVYVCVCDEWLI